MAKTCVGIDVGSCLLKLAVCDNGTVRRLVVEEIPDNLIRDGRIVSPEATAEFIKKTASKARIGTRRCGIILPATVAFTRTMTVPVMSREHLEINLPYEFRDFITQEKDKYFYDYAVTDTICDEGGNPQEFELIAASALKETIGSYSAMLRRAGFKLVTAIPEEMGYINIIRRFEEKNSGSGGHEYCFIDLGHTATRLHIFKGVKHQATRVIEFGVQLVDEAIADQLGVDRHIARARKHVSGSSELMSEACMSIYSTISIEVMRAINFYRFNTPDSNLRDIFLCGGGARLNPLVEQLASDIDMPIHRVDDLLSGSGENSDLALCPLAVGVTMQ